MTQKYNLPPTPIPETIEMDGVKEGGKILLGDTDEVKNLELYCESCVSNGQDRTARIQSRLYPDIAWEFSYPLVKKRFKIIAQKISKVQPKKEDRDFNIEYMLGKTKLFPIKKVKRIFIKHSKTFCFFF